MVSDLDSLSLAPGWWTRRLDRAARRFHRGEIDTITLYIAFANDRPLHDEAMRRIAAGTADPAAFVPFRPVTRTRHTEPPPHSPMPCPGRTDGYDIKDGCREIEWVRGPLPGLHGGVACGADGPSVVSPHP